MTIQGAQIAEYRQRTLKYMGIYGGLKSGGLWTLTHYQRWEFVRFADWDRFGRAGRFRIESRTIGHSNAYRRNGWQVMGSGYCDSSVLRLRGTRSSRRRRRHRLVVIGVVVVIISFMVIVVVVVCGHCLWMDLWQYRLAVRMVGGGANGTRQ